MTTDVQRTIHAIYRIEGPKLIAALARVVRDVGVAEDVAQDALVAALETWPTRGVPDNPGAWLMTTAKHRALDRLRHARRAEHKHAELEHAQPTHAEIDVDALDTPFGDDLLRLVFTCCHPVLSAEARVALTLRMLGGLTTEEIARGYLVPEPTIAQRIVRAKRTLADKQVPFEVPQRAELGERLGSVLEVIYLIYNEGYSATAGDDWMRPALCDDAMRLGRMLASLVPDEPEVHGLVALMEIQASRTAARTSPSGEPILLLEQNRARWDRILIGRGLQALARAEALVVERGGARGAYTLQAAIAACHARAPTADATDWAQIAALYAELVELTHSPVVELNRAVAVAMAAGPAAGLAVVDAIADHPALAGYHLLPAVRADFLAKLGRVDEARAELARAITLTKNARERAVLERRAAELAGDVP